MAPYNTDSVLSLEEPDDMMSGVEYKTRQNSITILTVSTLVDGKKELR